MVEETNGPSDPILAITGEDRDDVIVVDDERFGLRRGSSLSLRERAQVTRAMKRIDALEKLEEPAEADELDYTQQLEAMVAIALPALPADRRAKLTLEQKGDIATAFFARTAVRSERARILREISPSPSGSTSSPSSPASTAAGS